MAWPSAVSSSARRLTHRGLLALGQVAEAVALDGDDGGDPVVDQHLAGAVEDAAPGRLDLHRADAVGVGLHLEVGRADDLQVVEAGEQRGEQRHGHDAHDREPQARGAVAHIRSRKARAMRSGSVRPNEPAGDAHHRQDQQGAEPGLDQRHLRNVAQRVADADEVAHDGVEHDRHDRGHGRDRHRPPTRRPHHRGADHAGQVADRRVGQRGEPEGRVEHQVVGDAGGEAPRRAASGPSSSADREREHQQEVAGDATRRDVGHHADLQDQRHDQQEGGVAEEPNDAGSLRGLPLQDGDVRQGVNVNQRSSLELERRGRPGGLAALGDLGRRGCPPGRRCGRRRS